MPVCGSRSLEGDSAGEEGPCRCQVHGLRVKREAVLTGEGGFCVAVDDALLQATCSQLQSTPRDGAAAALNADRRVEVHFLLPLNRLGAGKDLMIPPYGGTSERSRRSLSLTAWL